ncbi:hypothetical protein HDE_12610 [Halotydeus destructor]|nr:hypothetical protein HDE_12610 [Halotydeus destructor]
MSEILMPGPKAGNDDEDPDALCQLADKWPSCWHHLDGLSCLEPSAASDMLPDFDLYDAFNIFPYHRHDLGSMVGDYRSKCAAAKVTSTPAMDDIFDDYLGGPYHDHLGDLP